MASKKSGPTPMAAAASGVVRAIRGIDAGSFFAPHGIWADSRGDVYVGEVGMSAGGKAGLIPLDCHSLQKFVRLR